MKNIINIIVYFPQKKKKQCKPTAKERICQVTSQGLLGRVRSNEVVGDSIGNTFIPPLHLPCVLLLYYNYYYCYIILTHFLLSTAVNERKHSDGGVFEGRYGPNDRRHEGYL